MLPRTRRLQGLKEVRVPYQKLSEFIWTVSRQIFIHKFDASGIIVNVFQNETDFSQVTLQTLQDI